MRKTTFKPLEDDLLKVFFMITTSFDILADRWFAKKNLKPTFKKIISTKANRTSQCRRFSFLYIKIKCLFVGVGRERSPWFWRWKDHVQLTSCPYWFGLGCFGLEKKLYMQRSNWFLTSKSCRDRRSNQLVILPPSELRWAIPGYWLKADYLRVRELESYRVRILDSNIFFT